MWGWHIVDNTQLSWLTVVRYYKREPAETNCNDESVISTCNPRIYPISCHPPPPHPPFISTWSLPPLPPSLQNPFVSTRSPALPSPLPPPPPPILIYPISAPLPHPLSPSLISRMVSVDVKHRERRRQSVISHTRAVDTVTVDTVTHVPAG